LTYGANCCSIVPAMLSSCGLVVEECYTAAWRESKYTLIRLDKSRRVRQTPLYKMMQLLHERHGIVGTGIFGFDIVASNNQANDECLFAHPGFKLMVEAINNDLTALESWMREGDVMNNRRGLLWKFIEDTPPRNMTRAQLVKRVTEWGPIVREHSLCGERVVETPKPLPSTHSILTKYRTDKALRDVLKKVGKASKQLNCTPSLDGSGEIYAAINPVMPHLFKMGFTFKDAETRVRALQTAGVLEPFELVRHAAVPDAR
jgi:hypothetical protein